MQREIHTEWKERRGGGRVCVGKEFEESERSEADANAEREADKKKLVMECKGGRQGGGGRGRKIWQGRSKGGWLASQTERWR